MDRTALEKYEQTVIAAHEKPSADFPVALVGKDFSLQSLEAFQHHRNRLRGAFSTSLLHEFVSFAKVNNKGADSQVFIDPDAMTATAIFNIGSDTEPGHADHTAQLKLKKTAPWEAVCKIQGQPLSQMQLSAWIEDWAPFIKVHGNSPDSEDPMADGEAIAHNVAITRIRQLTIAQVSEMTNTVGEIKGARSTLEQFEAKGKGLLPTTIAVETEPYLGFDPKRIRLRISIGTNGEKPVLVLRIVQFEALIEALGEELKERLQAAFKDSDISQLYIGSYNPNPGK